MLKMFIDNKLIFIAEFCGSIFKDYERTLSHNFAASSVIVVLQKKMSVAVVDCAEAPVLALGLKKCLLAYGFQCHLKNK